MDFALASVVPQRVASTEEARAVVAMAGAAILTGLPDPDAAIGAGRAMRQSSPGSPRTNEGGSGGSPGRKSG